MEFVTDADLGFVRSRTRFAAGEALTLDETYRLAHLPLVAPGHPKVIATKAGTSYRMGRHERVYSLVAPIDGAALSASPGYQALESELRDASFAGKIAWPIVAQRRDRLHATLCGGLSSGEPPTISDEVTDALAGLGPVAVAVRGLFSGNVNRGRLYLRAYPAMHGGENPFQRIQAILGRPPGDLYVIGVYNLTDDLDVAETAELGDLIERWWERTLVTLMLDRLWLMGSSDDLVLDSSIDAIIPLTRLSMPLTRSSP